MRNCFIESWSDYPKAFPLLKKIAHEWKHSNATQMVQRISDKEIQVFNNVHGFIKKQKSVTCVREISDVLAERKLASEEKQNVVVRALAIMRDCDPGQYRHQIDQIRKLIEGMQSLEEIFRLFSEKRDNELSTRNQTLKSLQGKLTEHFPVDMQPIRKAGRNSIQFPE